MGLYDNIILPEDFELPDFGHNPRYTRNNKDRLWQTKDLTPGQDRYRLRTLDSNANGTHQLERRVPPVQKMTKEGNILNADTDLLWWNIVRPTVSLDITNVIHNKIYEYRLDIVNGTLRNVELIDITIV
jgi:hypothetical protein